MSGLHGCALQINCKVQSCGNPTECGNPHVICRLALRDAQQLRSVIARATPNGKTKCSPGGKIQNAWTAALPHYLVHNQAMNQSCETSLPSLQYHDSEQEFTSY